MVKYEIKKIFSRTSGKLALLILFGVLVMTCYLAINSVDYVDKNGNNNSGILAAHSLKKVKNEWAGELTVNKLQDVVKENARINATPEYLSNNIQENNKAYAMKQGFMDIREIINLGFTGLQNYDYYRADSVTVDEVGNLYNNRINMVKTWLDTDAKDMYTKLEKQFIITNYEKLKTPLYYEYFDGWLSLTEHASTVIMLMMLITAFLVSGIFSSEFQLKADAIFFSTKLGRNKAVKSKLYAGLLVITVLYWGVMILYTIVVLAALGLGGANCMIQTELGGWKSLYHITYLQEYLLTLVGGYLGNLFILTASMFASAKTHSSVFAVTIPFILLFTPSFLNGISAMSNVLGLLPDQLLQMNMVVKYFNLYQVGGKVIRAVPILFSVYLVLFLALCPSIHHVYKKSEIK